MYKYIYRYVHICLTVQIGSGRTSGDFAFDPLSLGKDLKKKERYAVSEVKNGRLAMLAISGENLYMRVHTYVCIKMSVHIHSLKDLFLYV
jgi:hypothetical protein